MLYSTTSLPEAGKKHLTATASKKTATTTALDLPIGAYDAPYSPAWTKHLAKNHTLSFYSTHKPKSTNTPTITWDRRVRHTHHPPADRQEKTIPQLPPQKNPQPLPRSTYPSVRTAHPTSQHAPNTWQKNILSLSAPPINQNLPTRQPLPGPVGCVIRTTSLPEAGKKHPTATSSKKNPQPLPQSTYPSVRMP